MKRIVTGQDDIIGPWVCERTGGTWVKGRGTTIGLTEDGQLIAGVLYEDYNGANVVAHIAAEGKNWLNRDYLWFIFAYPFQQLKCKRITVIIAWCNEQSMKFSKKLGFRPEATLKDAHPTGDLNILVMRREDCRWLEIRHG